MVDKVAVGLLVRDWRTYRVMSLRELASAIGASKSALSEIETGKHGPSLAIALGLERYSLGKLNASNLNEDVRRARALVEDDLASLREELDEADKELRAYREAENARFLNAIAEAIPSEAAKKTVDRFDLVAVISLALMLSLVFSAVAVSAMAGDCPKVSMATPVNQGEH